MQTLKLLTLAFDHGAAEEEAITAFRLARRAILRDELRCDPTRLFSVHTQAAAEQKSDPFAYQISFKLQISVRDFDGFMLGLAAISDHPFYTVTYTSTRKLLTDPHHILFKMFAASQHDIDRLRRSFEIVWDTL